MARIGHLQGKNGHWYCDLAQRIKPVDYHLQCLHSEKSDGVQPAGHEKIHKEMQVNRTVMNTLIITLFGGTLAACGGGSDGASGGASQLLAGGTEAVACYT
ncbi:hypothetical protein GHA60_14930, partial [Enterococcus faecium]|nr:hypothetical protein [Enterococcus faecium]